MLDRYVNTVQCCDCLEFMKQLPDKCVDAVITDPPYGISFKSSWTDHHDFIENDSFSDWTNKLPEWLAEMARILTDNGCCCCCCRGGGGKTPVTALFTIEFIKHFNLIQTLVWDKLTIGLGWRYRPSYETILIGSKSKDNYKWCTERTNASNILRYNNVIPQDGEHPTVKPVGLMKELIENHTTGNDLILDPFAGSGTTLVACKELGRRYIGCEIEPKYVEIAERRLRATKEQFRLEF